MCLLIGAAIAAPAGAQSPLPPDNAGTGQYIEPVPDAGGDVPSTSHHGSGGGGSSSGPRLPERTRRALPSGAEGQALATLAGDPGATTKKRQTARVRARPARPTGYTPYASVDQHETAAGALASSATGGDGAAVPLLLGALGLMSLVAGALTLRRRARGQR